MHSLAADRPADDELTRCFHSHIPQLIPEDFSISPLPHEIRYWAVQVLRTLEYDSRLEASNESGNRVWRRWKHFLRSIELHHSEVHKLSQDEQDLVSRAFLETYRGANFDQSGRVAGGRKRPMAEGTLRSAAGSVAVAYRGRNRPSPFHLEDGRLMRPSVRLFLKY